MVVKLACHNHPIKLLIALLKWIIFILGGKSRTSIREFSNYHLFSLK